MDNSNDVFDAATLRALAETGEAIKALERQLTRLAARMTEASDAMARFRTEYDALDTFDEAAAVAEAMDGEP